MIPTSDFDGRPRGPGDNRRRLRVIVRGAVQGVGFRPFVFRLAEELGLAGWVINSTQGVFIEVEGERRASSPFSRGSATSPPPRASIQSLEQSILDPAGYTSFEIRKSDEPGKRSSPFSPTSPPVPTALDEIFDAGNRRHGYPFTNCTNCGPRFSIIEALPYDRPNTTMRAFEMCPECRRGVRRSRGTAGSTRSRTRVPRAGPASSSGTKRARWSRRARKRSREAASGAPRGGGRRAQRVGRFPSDRRRAPRHRRAKASRAQAPRRETSRADVSRLSTRWPRTAPCRTPKRGFSLSPESPIVLLERRRRGALAPVGRPGESVSRRDAPLHAPPPSADAGSRISRSWRRAATFPRNRSARARHEVLERLGSIADVFLVHDRPIARHVDDSVVRVVAGRVLVLRRARGYAPLPVILRGTGTKRTTLAVGAHLKNSSRSRSTATYS